LATIIIWLPLKDLETFDGFLRGLEAMSPPPPPPTLVAEARLRPLHDPTRMNGCALVTINDPPHTEEQADLACRWVADTLGEPGGLARVWRL
jgi:23S rRNA (adenine2030-N6)-methyltransferase